MKIEVLHERDPDNGCTVRVFLDGVEVTKEVEIQDVDPGAGHLRSEWDEASDELHYAVSLSRGFKAALLQTRDEASENSPYIEEE